MSLREKIKFEKGQETKREKIKKQMKTLKDDIKNQYNQYDNQSKIFENLKLEIDVLSNFKSYLKKEISGNKGNKKAMNDNHNNNSSTVYEKKNMFYQGVIGQTTKLRVNREQKEMSLVGVSLEKKKIKEKINELNDKLIEFKKEYNSINKELYIYYHQLLSEGIDCRKEGLIWIIKRIWNIGGNVIVTSFPNFIDKFTIGFLFALAAKSVYLDSVKSKIDILKGDNKKQVKNSKSQVNDNINQEREREKETEAKLRLKKKLKRNYSCFIGRNKANKVIKEEHNEKHYESNSISNSNYNNRSYIGLSLNSTLNSSLKYLSNKLHQTILFQLNQLSKEEKKTVVANNRRANSLETQELEDYYIKLNKEINAMKRKELYRINKEFYLNDYGKRYNIKQEIVISVLVGQEMAYTEMKRAKNEQKEYFQIMQILKHKIQIPKELQNTLNLREVKLNDKLL